MSDTLITVIAIFLAAILMFIFPLMAVSDSQEQIAQVAVQTVVSDFANSAATQGKITIDTYDTFIQNLHATGNTYDVEIEHQVLDENPGKKTAITSGNLVGENLYYSVYTNTIVNAVEGADEEYLLKKGDYLIVTVKNTNTTLASQIKNFFYRIVGNDTYTIAGSSSVLVVNTGS